MVVLKMMISTLFDYTKLKTLLYLKSPMLCTWFLYSRSINMIFLAYNLQHLRCKNDIVEVMLEAFYSWSCTFTILLDKHKHQALTLWISKPNVVFQKLCLHRGMLTEQNFQLQCILEIWEHKSLPKTTDANHWTTATNSAYFCGPCMCQVH